MALRTGGARRGGRGESLNHTLKLLVYYFGFERGLSRRFNLAWLKPSPRALGLWRESVWLLLGSRPRRWAGRSVWVFLAPGHFAAKTPADECWIVLDFLGFSRPNLDFSMGYEAFSGKNFSLSSSAGAETPIDRLPVDQAVQQVQDMGLGRGAGLQSQFDGGEHGLLVVLE